MNDAVNDRSGRAMPWIAITIVLAGLLLVLILRLGAGTREPVPVERATPDVVAPTRDPLRLDEADEDAERSMDSALVATNPGTADEFDAAIVAPDTGALRLYGSVAGSGAAVGLTVYVSCRDEHGVLRQQRVDADAPYEFSGLAPGRYLLYAAGRTARARRIVDVGADTRVDLRLDALRMLHVTVVDENAVPWAPDGIEVVVTLSDPGSWILDRPASPVPTGPTRRNGPGETRTDLGSWWIDATLPVHVNLVRRSFVVATQTFGIGDNDLVFRIDREDRRLASARVRFRVVDGATHEPIEPWPILLRGAKHPRIEAPGGLGEVTLEAGEYALTVSARPDLRGNACFRVEAAIDLDLGDIVLEAPASIRGTVVDALGRGVASSVTCELCDEAGVPLAMGTSRAESAQDGSFDLARLARGFYRVCTGESATPSTSRYGTQDFGLYARVVDLRGGDVEGVVLEERAPIEIRIRPSGRETIESRFRVRKLDGTVVAERAIQADDFGGLSVAPGEYDVERWHATAGPRERVRIRVVDEPVVVDMP